MQAGTLNSRVEIQHKVAAEDASGATVHEWRPLVKVWADVRHASGVESIKGDALVSAVRASIRIRYRKDVQASMRVVLGGGAAYEIQAVLPDLRRRKYVDLICEKVG